METDSISSAGKKRGPKEKGGYGPDGKVTEPISLSAFKKKEPYGKLAYLNMIPNFPELMAAEIINWKSEKWETEFKTRTKQFETPAFAQTTTKKSKLAVDNDRSNIYNADKPMKLAINLDGIHEPVQVAEKLIDYGAAEACLGAELAFESVVKDMQKEFVKKIRQQFMLEEKISPAWDISIKQAAAKFTQGQASGSSSQSRMPATDSGARITALTMKTGELTMELEAVNKEILQLKAENVKLRRENETLKQEKEVLIQMNTELELWKTAKEEEELLMDETPGASPK